MMEESSVGFIRSVFPSPSVAGLNEHISGVILFEETLFDKSDDGTPLPKYLQDQGIAIGIKVDLVSF